MGNTNRLTQAKGMKSLLATRNWNTHNECIILNTNKGALHDRSEVLRCRDFT